MDEKTHRPARMKKKVGWGSGDSRCIQACLVAGTEAGGLANIDFQRDLTPDRCMMSLSVAQRQTTTKRVT